MSGDSDYGNEMAEIQENDELLDLLPASSDTGLPLSPVAEFLLQLRAVAGVPLDGAVVAGHLAMFKDEAVNNPVGAQVAQSSSGSPVRRRRLAFGTLMSSLLVKALIGTAAFAAVGTGAAFAADGAVPGDALYGLDRAFEKAGVNNGGAAERIDEAMVLLERGAHPRAIETVQEAIEDLAGESEDANAIEALLRASEQIKAVRAGDVSGYQDTQGFRDQVAGLLGVIATEMENGKVDGALIAATAQGFSDTARDFAAARGRAPDDLETPPGSVPGNKPETPPGQANKPDDPGQP
jgi:hypothetical protein